MLNIKFFEMLYYTALDYSMFPSISFNECEIIDTTWSPNKLRKYSVFIVENY